MTAKQAGAGTSPPLVQKRESRPGQGRLAQHGNDAKTNCFYCKCQSDRYLMKWLRSGADYYRRLAHVTADAARKGQSE